MSLAYRAVGWNRQKRLYDLGLAAVLLSGLAVYAATTFLLRPATTPETFVIRFTSISALVLLHVILAIGPLARLDPRFLPLLYNRRHLGVTMFLLALVHGAFAIIQFHAGGDTNPLTSALTAYRHDYLSGNIAQFPFEALGMAALAILFLMAATSHDFWLKNLGPSLWKTLHMLVYAAYALVLAHVFLGALQSERSPLYPALLGAGFAILVALHLAAFARERKLDRRRTQAAADGFIPAGRCDELEEGRRRVVMAGDQRIALFLRGGKVFAISNVCRHQGGPLGEGRIVNGCLTCPWHGYQYRVEDGCSPPPFKEIAPTYAVRVIGGDVHVQSRPLPLETKSEGAPLGWQPSVPAVEKPGFYIGWQAKLPGVLRPFVRTVFLSLLISAPLLLLGVAWVQSPLDAGGFEFGVERTFEGTLHETPLALLQVAAGQSRGGMNFLLVGAGKFGPPDIIKNKGGRPVRLKGSLIQRNGVAMIEMNKPDSFEVLGAAAPANAQQRVVSLGQGAFVGELVDTKCFFGVMRPATGKVHRGCAIRCLSGGAPPGLLVRDDAGNGIVLLLAGLPGSKLDLDVELAARALEVRGELELHNGTPILRTRSWKPVD
jgi:DMSO/TMAO reductase YedYZ heme-binding membrane subunit/nitrite reductase/ring-hydroxylating ferredoxin subunit